MKKELKVREVLPDSTIPVKKGVKDDDGKKLKPIKTEYDAAGEIEQYGLKPVETFEYVDPITKEKKKFTLDRRGTTEQTVALTLLDAGKTREQKDSVVSMYLFEKGKQGASMLMDLWSYKGAHTKESRAFQSTMRFDFEMFLHTFQIFMQDSADLIDKELGVKREVVDGKTITRVSETSSVSVAECLGELASYFRMTSDLLGKRMRTETEKRERAKGKGIYIGLDDKPYSLYEDDDIVDVVRKDKTEADASQANEEEKKKMNENDGKSYINDKRACSIKGCKNTGSPYCYEHDAP